MVATSIYILEEEEEAAAWSNIKGKAEKSHGLFWSGNMTSHCSGN